MAGWRTALVLAVSSSPKVASGSAQPINVSWPSSGHRVIASSRLCRFHLLVWFLTLPSESLRIINISIFSSMEDSLNSLPCDLLSPVASANYDVLCPSDTLMYLLRLCTDCEVKPSPKGPWLCLFFDSSWAPESHIFTCLSLPNALHNESSTLPQQHSFETGAISGDKAVGNPRGFPVIKTGSGVHRVQTPERDVAGSTLLATDCTLDTWRLDWVGQWRCNGREGGRARRGNNSHLLDQCQRSAACGFNAKSVLLSCPSGVRLFSL